MTNSTLISILRQAMKDTNTSRQKRTDAVYASILTLGQGFLNRELELCRKEFSLSLVAGTQEYSADSAFVKFVESRLRQKGGCVYWDDGNLTPISTAKLDADEPGWRGLANGTPQRFYTEIKMSSTTSVIKIGLDRPPSSTFVASVPTLTYYGVVRPADIAANSNYPFDNNRLFEDFDNLLISWALAELNRQDGNHEKADARLQKLVSYLDTARTWVPGRVKARDGFRFDSAWRV